MSSVKGNSIIQSLKTGLSIIDLLVDAKRPMHISEIQEKTHITKSNLYKYMNTLIQTGMVTRDNYSGLYGLGAKLLQYGISQTDSQDIMEVVQPYMREVSAHTESSVLFATPTANGPVILRIFHPNQTLNIGAELGTVLPPKSAGGKIFHTFSRMPYSDEKITFTTDEIKQIKKDKIAFAKEPLISEISSVSIPVLGYGEELLGIIIVVGFSSRIPQDRNHETSDFLKAMQNRISSKMN